MGTNYQRGRSREYKVLHMLREKGWVCTRSAMSHGPVDIVAARSGRVLLIQVKSGKGRMAREELVSFQEWASHFNADAEIWFFKKRGKLEKKIVRKNRVDGVSKKARKATTLSREGKETESEPLGPAPITSSSSALVP